MKLLKVNHLSTYFKNNENILRAVDDVSFDINDHESLAIVGESGCGKSTVAMSIMGLLQNTSAYHPSGEIFLKDTDLLKLNASQFSNIRGNKMGMIFQEPFTSLNPLYTIANQIQETVIRHLHLGKQESYNHAVELLQKLGLTDNTENILKSYPHQLSGGMRQRIMIAMAIICKPSLIIADEPTTALDVSVQGQVLSLIKDIQKTTHSALLLITHDLGIVNQMVEKIIVMYAGRICEKGSKDDIIRNPKHPYTIKLMEALPEIEKRGKKLASIPGMVEDSKNYDGCLFANRCFNAKPTCFQKIPPLVLDDTREIYCHFPSSVTQSSLESLEVKTTSDTILIETKDLKTHFPIKQGFFRKTVDYVRAVDGISLKINEGSSLAIVGESGHGKSTFGQGLLRLIEHTTGSIYFNQVDLMNITSSDMTKYRKDLQIVFQDPFSSLNPRMTVYQIITEGPLSHFKLKSSKLYDLVSQTIKEVGLDESVLNRYPHQFSGGQRQRIAMARSLILRPKFIILDEATSALDISVQAQILNLLHDLQQKYNLTYLFITHDIGVVSYISDQMAVIYQGKIVEHGKTTDILQNPRHPYTKGLISTIPNIRNSFDKPMGLKGEVKVKKIGCPYSNRCPNALPICEDTYPHTTYLSDGRMISCHLFS